MVYFTWHSNRLEPVTLCHNIVYIAVLYHAGQHALPVNYN